MIGDVCGKGIPAALFMAMTQIVMRSTLRQQPDVGAAVTAGNALLAANNREMMYTTLICAVLELRTGVLRYCSCGHPAPFILRKRGGVEIAEFSLNRPLGLQAALKIQADTIVLEPGDRMFLYTDGFVDAINQGDEQFGDERLVQTVEKLRALPSQQLIEDLTKAVDEFAGDAPQFDDLTAVLIAFAARKTA
jgi:energy-coupling factor transport system substrate-specific component